MKPQVQAPRAVPVYEAIVDVAPPRSLGRGPLGERRIIDIIGGEFEGPRLRGRVLPGGADRQLLLPDGVRRLKVLYEMETDDGSVLTVHNEVRIVERPGQERYAFSHVKVTAPAGPHAWLSEAVLVGTLHPLMPARQAVLISVFQLT